MSRFRPNLPTPPTWPPARQPGDVALALAFPRLRDPVGHQIHAALAMLHLFTLPLHTVASGITFGFLVVFALLRIKHLWRSLTPLMRLPLLWIMLAWAAWSTISLAWSIDVHQGLDELAALRMLLTTLLVWPVVDRAPWLIGAALAGVFAQNLVQLAQQLEVLGLDPGPEGRLGGFLHPVKTGAWCAAAMCWHLSAALHHRGWLRWISLPLLAAAGMGLVGSGSRGPWLAAAVALPAALVVISLRRPKTRPAAIIVVVLGLLGAGAGWLIAHDMIESRVRSAFNEVRSGDGEDEDRMLTSSGLRLQMWEWAWRFFRQHPVHGVGVGSYRKLVLTQPEYLEAAKKYPEKKDNLARHHPHSTYLYALACLGAIGGVILAAWLIVSIVQSWKDPPDHPFADGMLFALLTWLIGAQFDCYNLNGEEFGLLLLIVTLTLSRRPAVRMQRSADDDLDQYTAAVNVKA